MTSFLWFGVVCKVVAASLPSFFAKRITQSRENCLFKQLRRLISVVRLPNLLLQVTEVNSLVKSWNIIHPFMSDPTQKGKKKRVLKISKVPYVDVVRKPMMLFQFLGNLSRSCRFPAETDFFTNTNPYKNFKTFKVSYKLKLGPRPW